MSTTPGPSHGARRGGGGRRIGRPRNRPPPPPRENPREIQPRPQAGDDQRRPRQRSPAGAADQANVPRAPGHHTLHIERPSERSRRNRAPRRLNQNLREGEYEVDVRFLGYDGNWVTLPGLISPYWDRSYIFPETVEAVNYVPSTLSESHISATPRGPNRDDRSVGLYIEVREMGIPVRLVILPVFNRRELGVSVVLGNPFIEHWYGPNNWPPRDGTLSVSQVATMPSDVDLAAWYYNGYDFEYQEGMTTSDDSNVQQPQSMEYDSINYDLMAVGTGIPNGYTEFLPDITNNTEGYADGYLQEG